MANVHTLPGPVRQLRAIVGDSGHRPLPVSLPLELGAEVGA